MLLNDPCIFMVYALEPDTKLDSIFCVLVHCHIFGIPNTSYRSVAYSLLYVLMQVSTTLFGRTLVFSERIWSAPLTVTRQAPQYPTSHCFRKLAGDFVFTETSLSSLLSTAPEDHTAFTSSLALFHAIGH
jgi:hypothetical protein